MKMGNLKRGKISGPLWMLLRAGNRTKVDASKAKRSFNFVISQCFLLPRSCNRPNFFFLWQMELIGCNCFVLL